MCLFQFWFPQCICLGAGLLGHVVVQSQFFKESPYCLPQWLYQFTFPSTVQDHSLFSTSSPAFIVCRLFDDGHSDLCEMISHVVLTYIFLIMSNVEHLFICLLANCMSSLDKCLFKSFCHFLIMLFVFLALSCMSCLYILEINICQFFPLLLFSPVLKVVFSPCLKFSLLCKSF